MPDQGIDLAQRKWSGRSAVERAPQKAGGGHAEVQRRRGGVRDGGRPGLVDAGEHAEDAPDADGPVMLVEVLAEGANAGPGPRGAGEQREGGAGRPRRPVRVVDAMPAAGRAERLPEEHPGGGGQEPHPGPVPLHLHALPDPPGRRTVGGRLDLDTAVEVHGPDAVAVVAKRLERERPQRRAFLGKHRRDLPVGRAVDPGVGPAGFPAIEICLGADARLEAEALERGLLGVADTGFDRARPIRVADTARQRDDPVVRQHVPVERSQGRVVDVRGEHPLA